MTCNVYISLEKVGVEKVGSELSINLYIAFYVNNFKLNAPPPTYFVRKQMYLNGKDCI